MKTEKFYLLLDELKECGMDLYGYTLNNINSVESRNLDFFDMYSPHSRFILGSAPSGSDFIDTIPYDIIFNLVEQLFGELNYNYPIELYQHVHDVVSNFNKSYVFDDLLNQIKILCGNEFEELYENMADSFYTELEAVESELQELLNDYKEYVGVEVA